MPIFVWAFTTGRPRLALAIFIGAALTDGVDGLLARALRQQTALGAVLDPIADKLLVLAALVVLALEGELPNWLLALVVVKEGGTLLAVWTLRSAHRPVPIHPSRMGKYATFGLAATLALALARRTAGAAIDPYLVAMALLAAECVIVTVVQYFERWRRLMRAPP